MKRKFKITRNQRNKMFLEWPCVQLIDFVRFWNISSGQQDQGKSGISNQKALMLTPVLMATHCGVYMRAHVVCVLHYYCEMFYIISIKSLSDTTDVTQFWSYLVNSARIFVDPALTQLPFPTAQLRPSRELLEYYRKKISEFDSEHSVMLQKLDDYRATYEEQVRQSLTNNSQCASVDGCRQEIADCQLGHVVDGHP